MIAQPRICRTAEHVRRLTVLAEFFENFLQTHQPGQFSMGCFADENDCGTVACVAGWAGLIPEFRELGLRTSIPLHGVGFMSAKGSCLFGVDGFRCVFGLTHQEGNDLCFSGGYRMATRDITPAIVAARLRQLIADSYIVEESVA